MKYWTLREIVRQFGKAMEGVDLTQLPERDSEEYRQFILDIAENNIFHQGRYSTITEYLLEIFDIADVDKLIHDQAEIDALSDEERTMFALYMDIKDVCYPLFKGNEVDWSAWPWQMKDSSSSMDNAELYDMLTDCERPCLCAAVFYDLMQRAWERPSFYSSVALNAISGMYEYEINTLAYTDRKSDEDKKKLATTINECSNRLWFIENHIHVGHQLGFDHLTQSVYDAFDTFIDDTYRHNQVDCARELAAWIRENMTTGEPHTQEEKEKALGEKMQELMKQHEVTSPDMYHTWNIITLDVLGMSMFSKEMEEADDGDIWISEKSDSDEETE